MRIVREKSESWKLRDEVRRLLFTTSRILLRFNDKEYHIKKPIPIGSTVRMVKNMNWSQRYVSLVADKWELFGNFMPGDVEITYTMNTPSATKSDAAIRSHVIRTDYPKSIEMRKELYIVRSIKLAYTTPGLFCWLYILVVKDQEKQRQYKPIIVSKRNIVVVQDDPSSTV